jgi:23S rRNA pseudouridine1911/1915/1917 synthase
LDRGEGGTLLDWYAALFPEILKLKGRKTGEGGLLHRLDFETRGLVLFAKNQASLDFLLGLQEEGGFVKEYNALCQKAADLPRRSGLSASAGFPPPPQIAALSAAVADLSPPQNIPFTIESFFRPFGQGRKEVRPVTLENKHWEIAKDRGETYKTHVVSFAALDASRFSFTLRITRGFRHQIRCHLAWLGFPILNDPIYGETPGQEQALCDPMALCCQGLLFTDPQSGEVREYRIRENRGNKKPENM